MQEKDPPNPVSAPVTHSDATTQASYQLYFSSGLYDRRYPAPNKSMWRRIEAFLSADASVLDFGCGSGRYLLRLKGHVARAIGFDVSTAALGALRTRGENWPELVVLGPDAKALDAYIAAEGQVDLVLCLFGVLGHITDETARADALLRLRSALKTGSGRLLVSVPNRARRFQAEQATAKSKSPVRYHRKTENGGLVVLNYQLFDPGMLASELERAGFTVTCMGCESVLPETWLLHNAFLRWLDGLIAPICPTRWGYGIFAEASC